MNKMLFIAACTALSTAVAFASPSRGATAFFVTVKTPSRAAVDQFAKGTFTVTVSCRAACKATTTANITAKTAKRLGFKNVKKKLVLVATSTRTLKARTPTKMALTLTTEATKRFADARGPVRIFGSAKGVPTNKPTVNYSVGWSSTLT